MVSVTFLLQYLYGGERKIVSLIEITIQKDLLNSPFSQGAGRGGVWGWGIISVTLHLMYFLSHQLSLKILPPHPP